MTLNNNLKLFQENKKRHKLSKIEKIQKSRVNY